MLPLRRLLLLTALVAFSLGSPASPRAWALVDFTLEPVPIPPGEQVAGLLEADLDGEPGIETLLLKESHLEIRSGDVIRWQSPEAWQVRQAALADLDRDGRLEAALLVWRPFKPWPVDAWLPHGGQINEFHDSAGMSCHLILVGWRQGAFHERWAGSALAQPVKSFAALDPDGSGRQFLVTLETRYNAPLFKPAMRIKVWEWNGFGFTVVSHVEGSFRQLSILRAENGHALILAP